jgi:hypothetical protein
VISDVGRMAVMSHVVVVVFDAGRVVDDQGAQGQPVFQLIEPGGRK